MLSQRNFCKFAFKILPSGAMSAKKFASVGVKYGTVKREKLVLQNRIK